jgi:hypothetical protein
LVELKTVTEGKLDNPHDDIETRGEPGDNWLHFALDRSNEGFHARAQLKPRQWKGSVQLSLESKNYLFLGAGTMLVSFFFHV